MLCVWLYCFFLGDEQLHRFWVSDGNYERFVLGVAPPKSAAADDAASDDDAVAAPDGPADPDAPLKEAVTEWADTVIGGCACDIFPPHKNPTRLTKRCAADQHDPAHHDARHV